MKHVSALLVVAILSSGCQTTRQAWIATAVGAGAFAGGGLIGYSARNDDEAGPALAVASLFVVAGGLTAVLSLIDALSGHPPETPPPARAPVPDRPACMAERTRISERAAATTDPAERGRILRSMPDCGRLASPPPGTTAPQPVTTAP